MIFEKTHLADVYIITLQPKYDERGFFARSFCKREFEQLGLENHFVQCNVSYNNKKGTLRGLHYQISPHEEVKIVSCRRGMIYDVVVDIRPHSPTYGKWLGIELSETNHQSLYIPQGFAHGFQTLVDHTEVFYLMGDYFYPSAARGIQWNDPTLKIKWPLTQMIISENDQNFPRFLA